MGQCRVQLRVLVELGNCRHILRGPKAGFQNERLLRIGRIHRLIEAAVSAHKGESRNLVILEKHTIVTDGTESEWHRTYMWTTIRNFIFGLKLVVNS